MLGGPTPEQLGRQGQLVRHTIEVAGLTVVVPSNPSLGGIDLSRVARCRLEDVYVRSEDPLDGPQPVNAWTVGLRLPDGLNFGRVVVDGVDVYGFYAGIVCTTAHTQIRHALVKWCTLGLGLTGSGQFNGPDPHGSQVDYLASEWCGVHVAAWSPEGGAGSLPPDRPFLVVVDLWDIEDGPAGRWYATLAHLVDRDDQVLGRANYVRVRADQGLVREPLVVSGGANFALTDLGGGS